MLVTSEQMSEKSEFSVDHQGFQDDLIHQKLRQILLTVINSDQTDQELKTLCVRLILRWGLVRGSAEDLLLAAQL